MGAEWLRLNQRDPLVVALDDLPEGTALAPGLATRQAITRGHKIAARPIAAGEVIHKFGVPIGIAKNAIEAGAHIHLHNLEFKPQPSNLQIGSDLHRVVPVAQPRSFQGYRRADGSVGTRNYLGILTTVNCSATASKQIAAQFRREMGDRMPPGIDGIVALSHQHGCSFRADGPSMEILRRTLAGYARHPNFAGVLVVGLGCEDNQIGEFLEKSGLTESDRVKPLVIQEEGGTAATVRAGVAALQGLLPMAAGFRREEVGAEHLTVGLQCGGSDGFSGLTANPALGRAVDILAAHGGTGILSETPEIYGAESLLLARTEDPAVAQKLIDLIRWWEEHAVHDRGSLDNNPSAGNKAGGLTTILEKSLGAVAKSGRTPLMGVYNYAEPIAAKGFVFMDSPGYDPVSATGQVASGANLICFTTGRGSCFGCKPVPSLKLATNTTMFERMKGDMDINCGEIADGTTDLDTMGERIFDLMIETASGRQSVSEQQDYGDEEFVPWSFGAIY